MDKKETLINPVDLLLDPDNYDNIVLYNDKDEPVEFEQYAIIPIDGKTYVILSPVEKLEGMDEDEAFAFEIIFGEENSLMLVEDQTLIDEIFNRYKNLYNAHKK